VSDRPGYVYVIHNAAWPGWVKVGHVLGVPPAVKRVLQKRVSNYNVADPHKGFVVSESFYAACALVAEDYAHKMLLNYQRGDGEWFACPVDEAQRIVREACRIARLRPSDRGSYFETAIREERNRMNSDTRKIRKEDVTKQERLPDVADTARAAHQIIQYLLESMAMPDEKLETAARAVQRRLDVLGGRNDED